MIRTFVPPAERDALLWQPLAAALLGIEGMRTLLYAAFLGTQIADGGVVVPVVGAMPYAWIVPGVIALVAAAGVLARRSWGRYLGSVTAVLMIMTGLFNAPQAGVGVIAIALPCIVLFALWRKWPSPSSVEAGVVDGPSGATAPVNVGAPDHRRVHPEDQAA